jgi:hypothetical protein
MVIENWMCKSIAKIWNSILGFHKTGMYLLDDTTERTFG